MTISIIPHQYQNFIIEQATADTTINGIGIPKGYVNATAMCKANKKRLEKYFEFSKTKPFLKSLEFLLNSRYPSGGERLIIVIKGGDNLATQGTWVHPSVGNNLAQWISPEFAAWASEVLSAVLRGDYLALTEEAQEAQSRFQEEWQKVRYSGKVARRSLTDAIKEYCIKHQKSESYQIFIYPNVSDCLNRALFTKTAKQLCEERNCSRDELRNTHNDSDLRRIEHIEQNAMKLIDKRNIEPLQAMQQALDLYL